MPPEFAGDGVAHKKTSDRIALAYDFCYSSAVFKTMSYEFSFVWYYAISFKGVKRPPAGKRWIEYNVYSGKTYFIESFVKGEKQCQSQPSASFSDTSLLLKKLWQSEKPHRLRIEGRLSLSA